MSGWLTAFRIARRQLRRARGRSALVVVLLGLPVLVLTVAAVSYQSFRLTTEQQLERELGAADALLTWEYADPVEQSPDGLASSPAEAGAGADRAGGPAADLPALLPAGSRAVPIRSGELELRTATGIGRLTAEGADLTDPIHAGRLVLRDGRAPATDREMALTRRATGRLGVSIGGTVRAADGSASWTVVGIVEYPERFREAVVLRPPALPAEPARWLVAAPAPVSWDQVRALNQHGIVVRSRAVVLDPPPTDQVPEPYRGSQRETDQPPVEGALLAAPVMLEVGLLAGAAFAVGARRRARDLALVAVAGGKPAHQRRIVLADGLLLGLTAAAAGIGLGILAAAAGMPLLEEQVYGRRAGGLRLWLPVLAGIGGLAVGTGLLAALAPALAAARLPVVAGLASRRGVRRSRRRWLVLGLALVVLGAGLALLGIAEPINGEFLAVVGLIVSQLGLVLCTPAAIGLVARVGRFLPVAPRIAVRDTARNRAAAAPAITAVMAAVAGVVTIGIVAAAEVSRYTPEHSNLPVGSGFVSYRIPAPGFDRSLTELHEQALAAVRNTAPLATTAEVRVPGCPPGTEPGSVCEARVLIPEQNACPWSSLERDPTAAEQRSAARDGRCHDRTATSGLGLARGVVDDGTALPLLTGASGADLAGAVQALRAGGVVVTNPWAVEGDQVTIEGASYAPDGTEPARVERFTAPAHVLTTGAAGPQVIFSPGAAERAGVAAHLTGLVAAPQTGFTQARQDTADAALQAIDPNLRLFVQRPRPGVPQGAMVLLAVAGGVVMLSAAAVATGLAAADRRPDLATLGAVGASPRVRRLLSLSQSGVIAGVGALLGVVAGLGGTLGILSAVNRRLADTWPQLVPSYPLEVPWTALAILLVAVPVAAMLGAGLLTRSRLPIERRW